MLSQKNLSLKEQGIIHNYRNNLVIVRVWTSGANLIVPGDSVGHVSLEIPAVGIYMSLWPFQGEYDAERDVLVPAAKDTEGPGIITGIGAEDIESFTYKKDLIFEGRKPEVELCFYTLDTVGIQGEYQRYIERSCEVRWGLLGCNGAKNCASTVWELLVAGNIRDLLSAKEQVKVSSQVGSASSSYFFSGSLKKASSREAPQASSSKSSIFSTEWLLSPFIESPDMLAEYLKEAKRIELQRYPLTGHSVLLDEEKAISKIEHSESSTFHP